MSNSSDELYQKRIAELEAENARLSESLDVAITERRELRERVYGKVKEEDLPTEEDCIELMKNHVPGSGMKFLEKLGLYPRKFK